MASETVRQILEAEALADRSIADARRRAEDIVTEAHRKGAVAEQKKLAEAKAECEKIRQANKKRLEEYTKIAEEKSDKALELLRSKAKKNTEKAVSAIMDGFF